MSDTINQPSPNTDSIESAQSAIHRRYYKEGIFSKYRLPENGPKRKTPKSFIIKAKKIFQAMPQKSAESPNPSQIGLVISPSFSLLHTPIILHFVDRSTLLKVLQLVAGALEKDKKEKKKKINFFNMIDSQSDSTLASSEESTTTSASSTSSSSDLELDHNDIVLGQADREHLRVSNPYWF